MSIAIEGTIGAGKTTLMKAHQQLARPDIIYRFEPVEQWINTNELVNFYQNPRHYALSFELASLFNMSRPRLDKDKLAIQERSIFAPCYIFGALQVEFKHMEQQECDILRHVFETRVSQVDTKGIFYIQTDSQTAQERIQVRNRPGEDLITPRYLSRQSQLYDNIFIDNSSVCDIPIEVVSVDLPASELINRLNLFIEKVNQSTSVQSSPPRLRLVPRTFWEDEWH